ncbi:MAG: peptidylprolyl isomerase [Chloracidobacterium sp.]|nr:peptidylprolyl isomerase [Chloracidobacterium sp.]MDW8216414.1 peptidylprolyl isomerase [Acidobacteriota bacterium]
MNRRHFLFLCCLVHDLQRVVLGQRRATTPPVLGRANSAQRLFARLLQLEDQRNYDDEAFVEMLSSSNARVRRRACLALGRIGDPRAYRLLLERLYDDGNARVRAMAAFALGELETTEPLEDLRRTLLREAEVVPVRARCAEALGKIVAANAKTLDADTVHTMLAAVLASLPKPDEEIAPESERELFTALSLTAAMRMRQAASAPPLIKLLASPNASVRFHAANALARLSELPETAQAFVRERERLLTYFREEKQAVVRVALARVLGALGDAEATAVLLKALEADNAAVRIAAIRALAATRVPEQAAPPLLAQLASELGRYGEVPDAERPTWPGLLQTLTLAETLGRLKVAAARPLLERLRTLPTGHIGAAPEVEIALARLGADAFFGANTEKPLLPPADDWRAQANYFAGLAVLPPDDARRARVVEHFLALDALDARARTALLAAIPKTPAWAAFWARELRHPDVMVRAVAAAALAVLPPTEDGRAALKAALKSAENDVQNDARLAILDALAADPHPEAKATLEAALRDADWLVRKRAGDILLRRLSPTSDADARSAQVEEIRRRVGICQVNRVEAFYGRLVRQYARRPCAVVTTTKGELTLELFPEDAPLTVENFITLAERGFFNDLTFHRVVPNFVVQGGDPRGDGDGGPGYQIRCEINERPFIRGSVGMALSGKDTGGSQWFICYLPQPHLDGGYTCFGQVVDGWETLDQLVCRDRILSVRIA